MSYILNIESSTKNCSISISNGNELLCLCEEYDENYSHSEKLHQFIQWALEGAEININQLDAVSVTKGPGSYTGLRIGVSAAKGLCFALNIPLIAIESLDILANSIESDPYDYVIPMLDARRMEVYTKTFNHKREIISNTNAKVLEENSFCKFSKNKVAFVGNGVEKANEILKLDDADFFPDVQVSAKNMITLSYDKFKAKEFENLAYFEPFYLKDFIAGKPKKLI